MTGLHVAVATAIIYAQIATGINDSEHEALKVRINDARHAKEFSTLLNSIVNVNKERYDTLKKMARLQQFPPYPPRQALRGGEESDDRSEEESDDGGGPEIVAYMVLPQQQQDSSDSDTAPFAPLPAKGRLNTSSSSQVEEDVPIRTDEDENTLRSCRRRGYKRCKQACLSAMRGACGVYSCERRLRRKFKRECQRSCRMFGGYSYDW